MSSFDHDPEMPTDDDADLTIGLDGDYDNFDSPTNTGGNRKKKWFIGATATSILLAIVALIVVMKRPADDTSVAAAAAAKRVANNFLGECCVNTGTGTCHDKDKCNKKEKECIKCNKNGDYAWMLLGNVPPDSREPDTDCGETPPDNDEGETPPDTTEEEPCCAIIATKICHEDDKCNKEAKNCLDKKCQKTGEAVWAVSSELTPVPTHVPTHAPTNSPTSAPSPTPTTGTPTSTPTTAAPTAFVDTTVYEYTDTGTDCSKGGGENVQGPAPLPNKKNVVVDFWVWGDTPYDFMVDSCLDGNGKPSTCNKCAFKNDDIDEMPFPNTCTFEGDDFNCVKDNIIPFINGKMTGGDGAFQVHLGDILKGTQGAASSRRCTPASFNSRKKLFQPAKNFLLINGDNESNECKGYEITKPTDVVREMWRSKFGSYSFTNDFPAITGGGKPSVSRVRGNEEIFGFEYRNAAFFGLDYPDGDAYLTKHASVDLNAKFVKDTLDSDTSCALKSIVIFSHVAPESGGSVEDELDDYFNRCKKDLPILTVVGNAHPKTYCLTKDGERLTLIVEAFQSGPALVSIVRDPKGGDYFHVADSDENDTNTQTVADTESRSRSVCAISTEAKHDGAGYLRDVGKEEYVVERALSSCPEPCLM